MPGTGIHGYTGTSANGLYNISNGIVQNSAPSTNANNIGFNSSSGSSAAAIGSAVANAISGAYGDAIASGVAGRAGTDSSDYGDMIRELINQSNANTAKSQQFAREQMEYQARSDANAMAWSANEAAKNRAWQESLADTAHQREVRDLIAAGLNPILSANQGAFTGSGATGQGFSSSGAMGQVDNAAAVGMSSLYNTMMNTASQAMIAGIYTDAERYQADRQYAASKMNTEASIMNNENTNSTQKYIAEKGFINDLQRSIISADAQKSAAYATAGAMQYSADQGLAGTIYKSDADKWIAEWNTSHDPKKDPVGFGINVAQGLASIFSGNPKAPFNPIVNKFNKSYESYPWNDRDGAS